MGLSRIVVTGHLGFIGSYLMPKLQNAIGLDIKEGNDILDCDLPDVGLVIHLAAEPGVVASVADPFKNAETNILGTIRLAERYKNAQFIFASSGGTIQETIESPYGLSKYVCEEYVKMLCNHPTILRFPNVYGKGSRSVVDKWLVGDELTIYGDGQTKRIYGYVEDIVEAIILSIDWDSGTYKLGSNQVYSVLEVAKAIDKPIKFAPARKGEITHTKSVLPNTTPNWIPKVELMDYIYGKIK